MPSLAGSARRIPNLPRPLSKMIKWQTGMSWKMPRCAQGNVRRAEGIATDAQLAAVGLGSIAQFKLSNQHAKEAAEATERQAQATLQMAQAYPGMSIEVAKQLRCAARSVGRLRRQSLVVGTDQRAASRCTIQSRSCAEGQLGL